VSPQRHIAQIFLCSSTEQIAQRVLAYKCITKHGQKNGNSQITHAYNYRGLHLTRNMAYNEHTNNVLELH